LGGNYRGFPVCISVYRFPSVLQIAARGGENDRWTDLLRELRAADGVLDLVRGDSALRITVQARKGPDAFAKIDRLLHLATAALEAMGASPCCFDCGEEKDLHAYLSVHGLPSLLCDDCAETRRLALESAHGKKARRKGNLLTGFFGALIGAAMACALWVLFAEESFLLFSIMGIAAAFFTLKGFQLCGGKLHRAGVALCIALLLLSLLCAYGISLVLTVKAFALSEYGFSVTFMEALELLHTGVIYVKWENLLPKVFLGGLFSALLSHSYIRFAHQKDMGKYRFQKVS
jgi:hypothetical protein